MPDTKRCAECGTPLPAYWPKGLCAQCTLEGALDMTNAESQVLQQKTQVIPADLKSSVSNAESSPLGLFGDYDLLDEIVATALVHGLRLISDETRIRQWGGVRLLWRTARP